jgi:hypothetical protein
MAYFPKDYTSEDQSQFESDLKKLIAVIEKESSGTHTASAGGWIEEEADIPGSSEKGKAYIAALGWHSIEAHMSFRETQHFKDNIHFLRKAKDLKTMTVTHASLTQIDSGPVGDLGASSAAADMQEEILNPQRSQKNPPKTRSDGTTT